MTQDNWRKDKCPRCGEVCLGRNTVLDERTCGKHWWKWFYGEAQIIREVGGVDHKQLQVELDRLCVNKTPEQVLSRLEAAGWHSQKFIHMGVIAVNPYYEDFNFGITAKWLHATRAPIRDIQTGESWLLWVYPTELFIEILED